MCNCNSKKNQWMKFLFISNMFLIVVCANTFMMFKTTNSELKKLRKEFVELKKYNQDIYQEAEEYRLEKENILKYQKANILRGN